jgi:endonuclease YncB( thermonuclease family)
MRKAWSGLLIGVAIAAIIAMMALAEGEFDYAGGAEDCPAPNGFSLAVCRFTAPAQEAQRIAVAPMDRDTPIGPGGMPPLPPEPCDLRVERVSDGDTFYAKTTTMIASRKVEEDTGFRLARVYSPERKEPGYDQAKRDLATMIAGRLVAVELVHPSGSKRYREKYGRFFVEVFLCSPDSSLAPHASRLNVNDAMRAAGWTDKGKGLPRK